MQIEQRYIPNIYVSSIKEFILSNDETKTTNGRIEQNTKYSSECSPHLEFRNSQPPTHSQGPKEETDLRLGKRQRQQMIVFAICFELNILFIMMTSVARMNRRDINTHPQTQMPHTIYTYVVINSNIDMTPANSFRKLTLMGFFFFFLFGGFGCFLGSTHIHTNVKIV